MDPTTTLDRIIAAINSGDETTVVELTDILVTWVRKGGFLPTLDLADVTDATWYELGFTLDAIAMVPIGFRHPDSNFPTWFCQYNYGEWFDRPRFYSCCVVDRWDPARELMVAGTDHLALVDYVEAVEDREQGNDTEEDEREYHVVRVDDDAIVWGPRRFYTLDYSESRALLSELGLRD